MKTEKERTKIYLNVDKEGNLYYLDINKDKIIIPAKTLVAGLQLKDIDFTVFDYEGNVTDQYVFSYVDEEDDNYHLTLNRYAHLAHLFVNKLLNTDVNRRMSIGAWPIISDGKPHRYITISQDKQTIKKLLAQEEYPAIVDKDNTERSEFFEEKTREIQKILQVLPESEPVDDSPTEAPLKTVKEKLADTGSVKASDIEPGEDDLQF